MHAFKYYQNLVLPIAVTPNKMYGTQKRMSCRQKIGVIEVWKTCDNGVLFPFYRSRLGEKCDTLSIELSICIYIEREQNRDVLNRNRIQDFPVQYRPLARRWGGEECTSFFLVYPFLSVAQDSIC